MADDAIAGVDVPVVALRGWHVAWSHDGRPTIVLDHHPLTRTVRTKPHTILGIRVGGRDRAVEQTRTEVAFHGRRDPDYRESVARLEALGVPRSDDEHRTLPGTRDERLGASVSPLLAWRTRRDRAGGDDLSASDP